MTPIALFVYNRPDHTKKTIEALLKNEGADKSALYIFCDGPKGLQDEEGVINVQNYIRSISGFASIKIIERCENSGLANSIIDGVTSVLLEHERVIVLEDDMETSPYFLRYMNDALEKFAQEKRVISIHGYCYPLHTIMPEAFFLRGADCWGWATWKRGWKLFNPDGDFLFNELKRKNLLREFDFNGNYGYSKMLENQTLGRNSSWAIRWHASAFLANKLTLYPGRSLIRNIGNDDSGTHCDVSNYFDVQPSQSPIDLSEIQVEPSEIARTAFIDFFGRLNQESAQRKLFSKPARLLKNLVGSRLK